MREIKIDTAHPTAKYTHTHAHDPEALSNALKWCQSVFQITSSRNLTLNHLHLGDEAELVFDLQEDGVEGQLVGLLIESG